jgi:hypothetical protein
MTSTSSRAEARTTLRDSLYVLDMGKLADLLRGWHRTASPYGSAAAPPLIEHHAPVEIRREVDEANERRAADEQSTD